MRSCWGCSTSCSVTANARPCQDPISVGPACRANSVAAHTQRPLAIRTLRPIFGVRSNSHAVRFRQTSQRHRLHITCSRQDSKSSNSKRPRRGWPSWNWLEHIPSIPRLVFNLTSLFLLMRIWPLSGRSPLGQAQPVSVQVPFSEFIQQTQSRQVVSVTVDNRNVKYVLRPDTPVFQNIPQSDEPINVAFQTTRPADYDMPYGLLTKQGVQFGAVDNRSNTFLTVMVISLLHTCLSHLAMPV